MSHRGQRNALLLFAIFAVATGGLLFLPRHAASPPPSSAGRSPAGSQTFAMMRSSRHQTAEEIAEHQSRRAFREALNAVDRCAALSKLIKDSTTARQALDWTKSIEDQATRNMALDSVACAWARCDARAAVAWALSTNEDPLTKSALITTVFSGWAGQNPKDASEFASTLDQADQTYAIAAVAPAFAAVDPKAAIQWSQSLAEEDARNLAANYVVNTWARALPIEAATWALTQPEGFNRADYVRTVVERWLETDANAAIEWVRRLPAGTSRDSALDLIANQFTDSDPAFAANYAENIYRPELRDARLRALANKALSKKSQP